MTDQSNNFSMPEPVKLSPVCEARHLVPFAEDMGAAGDVGNAIQDISIRALDRAWSTAEKVTAAENAVNVAQLALQKSGNGAAGLVQKDGKINAIPTAYAELASSAKPVLDKALETLDADIRKVASYQESLVKRMDEKLICANTKSDPQLRSDIRNHLKSLGKNKAKYAAVKAAMDGDLPTIHVILTGPSELMGLDATDVKTVRDTARKTLSPGIYKARETSDEILKRMTTASRGLGQKRDSIASYTLADQQAANDALSKLRGLARS